ncbi:MAG: class I SAM-dependent methyltransferase, partial [Deltaproteobacteria bacterium]|nr:class I SAM-dependent methyltransferase [Deltaproteobacteria bacterium]
MSKTDRMYDNHEIVPKARSSIHTVIVDWLSTQERGKVLDAPAGYGHLSRQLKALGFDVVCGEIEPEIFKVKEMPCLYTDLNRKIDSADETFDYVCCVEGLEHMTDPYKAVEELARVLKTGGVGIFSLPNYSNIEKRLKYLLKGYLTRPKTVADYRTSGSNLYNFHNSPLSITLLNLIFSINGLKIEAILRDKRKRKQSLLLPLVAALRTVAFLSSKETRRKHQCDLTLRDEVILGGNTLIFITRKSER